MPSSNACRLNISLHSKLAEMPKALQDKAVGPGHAERCVKRLSAALSC